MFAQLAQLGLIRVFNLNIHLAPSFLKLVILFVFDR